MVNYHSFFQGDECPTGWTMDITNTGRTVYNDTSDATGGSLTDSHTHGYANGNIGGVGVNTVLSSSSSISVTYTPKYLQLIKCTTTDINKVTGLTSIIPIGSVLLVNATVSCPDGYERIDATSNITSIVQSDSVGVVNEKTSHMHITDFSTFSPKTNSDGAGDYVIDETYAGNPTAHSGKSYDDLEYPYVKFRLCLRSE